MRVRGPADPAARLVLLVLGWAVTRFLVLVATRSPTIYPYQNDPLEISVFAAWGAAFVDAGPAAPLRDGPWEYPAGAAAVVVAPALLRGAPYVLGFVGQMVLWDLAVLLVLALVGLRRGSLAGAWLWVAVVPLLGPVALARFDVVPTALAVAGLAAAPAAPFVAGLLVGAGAVVKLWPALLVVVVLLVHDGRRRVLAGTAGVGTVVLLAVELYGGRGQLLSFLTYQRDRGLQVESLPALPLMAARAWGDERMTVGFAFGSSQVDGPWADTMLRISTLGTLLVLLGGVLLAVRLRRPGADRGAGVAAVSVALLAGVLVFGKALSAQYPLWLSGLVCVGLCRPASPLRTTVPPLGGLLLLTQLVYPLSIVDLVDEAARQPVVLLALRDLLLVVVLVQAAVVAWRLGSPPPPSEQRVGRDEHRGENGHAARAHHEHQLVRAPALGEPRERPHDREHDEQDPGQ